MYALRLLSTALILFFASPSVARVAPPGSSKRRAKKPKKSASKRTAHRRAASRRTVRRRIATKRARIPRAAARTASGSGQGTGACWPQGRVCRDDTGPESCIEKCCSKRYVQAKTGRNKGKDVCTAPTACWRAGTKCWDNLGEKSCKLRCCSGRWHQDRKKGYDVCDTPAAKSRAVVGYGGPVDAEMRQTLQIGMASCWRAGTKCWNNKGPKSCWDNCCSKAYYHDDKKGHDVCAPIPKDGKCYAQYTPCWDKLPTPRGKYYVEVSNGKKVYFPSCFQCCARIAANGRTHWPAWTEYYIGDGRHDATSQKTRWFDSLVAGAKGLNPVQSVIDQLVPSDRSRQKRGGQGKSSEVANSIARGFAKKIGKEAAKAAGQAVGKALGAAGPVGAVAGAAFSFLFEFFSKLTEPKWDLCD